MIPNSRLQDVDPETNVVGLGAPIPKRRPDLPVIGPDTEGLSPGFHKQSNGMLMYVPNMADPIYDEPEEDTTEVDIQCDDTRPVGFYNVLSCGTEWIRYWAGGDVAWRMTGIEVGDRFDVEELRQWMVSGERTDDGPVVRLARPDLDTMVLE
jgi:hypothetical protein